MIADSENKKKKSELTGKYTLKVIDVEEDAPKPVLATFP